MKTTLFRTSAEPGNGFCSAERRKEKFETKTEKKSRFTTADLVYTAICTTLIAVCSWIQIPTVVPFTLQTFAVFCALELLGGKRGTFSVVVYLLMAAVGLPVLAGFGGGLGLVLGTTGGYLLGFLFIGLVYWLFESVLGTALPIRVTALLLGLVLCYTFGTAWFMLVYARTSGPIGLGTALGWCVFPFIIPDLAKLALAITVASRLRKGIKTSK